MFGETDSASCISTSISPVISCRSMKLFSNSVSLLCSVFPGRGFGEIFVRNALNAVNFCKKGGDCGECDENKYFTAFHRISYKSPSQNSPHFLQKFTVSAFVHNNVRNAV